MHTIYETLDARVLFNATTGTSALNTPFIAMAGWQRMLFEVIAPANLSANLVATAYQATDAEGTGAEAIVDGQGDQITVTFVNGSDDGLVGRLEVLNGNVAPDFSYVGVHLVPTNDQAVVVLVEQEPIYFPATNATNYVAGTSGGYDGYTTA